MERFKKNKVIQLYMKRNESINLTLELKEHPMLAQTPVDWGDVFNLLYKTNVPSSRRFAKKIKEEEYLLDRTHDYLTNKFMLRRVLRNEIAARYLRGGYGKGAHKNLWEVLNLGLGIYDSDVFTRKLREDPEMLEMMAKALEIGHPYSITGKITTYDKDSLKIQTRPIVAIHGADIDKIVQWELANRVYGLRNSSEKIEEISERQYFGR